MRKIALLLTALFLALALSGGAFADMTLTLTDAVEQQNAFGRCVAPAGYSVRWKNAVCGPEQSVAYPCQLAIEAASRDGEVVFTYFSDNYYLAYDGVGSDRDGEYNTVLCMPVLHYMNAAEYCDHIIHKYYGGMDTITPVWQDDFPNLDAYLAQKLRQLIADSAALEPLGLQVDAAEATVCYRLYRMTQGDQRFYGAVLTGVSGLHMTSSYIGLQGPVTSSGIQWQAPFTYNMLCPEDQLEEVEPAFTQFCINTGVSDQYRSANEDMSAALWQIVKDKNDLSSGRGYSVNALLSATRGGDDYDEERITDYIFDQNDFTLSDGSHVKIDTRYDYVYELDGSVYAADSALAQPGGGQRLYPNS